MSLHEPITAAEGVPFFTPKQTFIAGTALDPQPENKPIPAIFRPLTLKGGLTLQNRIGVSPMCQYSADRDHLANPWHSVHYGELVNRGPGLTFVESTAVSPEGSISPNDLALYNDEQAKKLKEIVDYAHSQRQNIGIQLAHSGRKGSTQPAFVHLEQSVPESEGGWPTKILAPSALTYRPGGLLPTPNELTIPEIKRIIKDFGTAAKRAVEISGFDVIEIHGAHGYLVNEFYSKISNKRTDEYGGSFDNRIRFLLEVIDEIKANVPKDFPIFLRIAASDNTDSDPDAWKIEDSVKLAPIVVARGIELIDVSSGGNNSAQNARGSTEAMHAELARAIKKEVGDTAFVSTVGNLTDPKSTNQLIEEGAFDFAFIGKGFLKNPGLVIQWANELGVRIQNARQIEWALHTDIPQIVSVIQAAAKNVSEQGKKQ